MRNFIIILLVIVTCNSWSSASPDTSLVVPRSTVRAMRGPSLPVKHHAPGPRSLACSGVLPDTEDLPAKMRAGLVQVSITHKYYNILVEDFTF